MNHDLSKAEKLAIRVRISALLERFDLAATKVNVGTLTKIDKTPESVLAWQLCKLFEEMMNEPRLRFMSGETTPDHTADKAKIMSGALTMMTAEFPLSSGFLILAVTVTGDGAGEDDNKYVSASDMPLPFQRAIIDVFHERAHKEDN